MKVDKSALTHGVPKHNRKTRRGLSAEHLAWIRTHRSLVSRRYGCIAHHLMRVPEWLGGCRGTGMKNPDVFAVPLTQDEHEALHTMGEKKYFLGKGIEDPVRLALGLALNSPVAEIREYARELLER